LPLVAELDREWFPNPIPGDELFAYAPSIDGREWRPA
jgi:hypothetical protein